MLKRKALQRTTSLQPLKKISVKITFSFQWVRCYMMTSWNGNIFRVTGHLCGEFTGPQWIPRTKASDAELWCFFDLRLNKRLSKQSWGWWFETLSRQLWRHRNDGYPQPHLVRGIVIVCICMSLWSSLWLFSVCLFDKPSMIIDGLVQDCSNSIAKALELLQSCTKPSIWFGLVKCTLGSVTLL